MFAFVRSSVYFSGFVMGRSKVQSEKMVCARSALRHRGATLIELLVVMAMIGLLISILIPSLKQSMDLAKATVCMHNLREIGHSLRYYRYDNDGWLPAVARTDLGIEAIRSSGPWFVKLYPSYLSDPMLLTCPEDPFKYRMAKVGGRLADPSVADYPSYGINSFLVTSGNGFLADVDRHQPARPLDTILVADLGPDDLFGQSQAGGVVGPIRNASLLAWDDGFDPLTGRTPQPWLTTRHRRGIHVLTLAGGVREALTSEIMRRPIRRFYDNCSAGGCTFCNHLRLIHYSFARDHLYWWTGPVPSE